MTTTLSGKLLPPQLICIGSSPRCHTTGVTFPNDWNITHSENHWSNEQTMLEFIDSVILRLLRYLVPFLMYLQHIHRCSSVLDKLHEASVKVCFIPAGCTGL